LYIQTTKKHSGLVDRLRVRVDGGFELAPSRARGVDRLRVALADGRVDQAKHLGGQQRIGCRNGVVGVDVASGVMAKNASA
jgi:hypothetical protein